MAISMYQLIKNINQIVMNSKDNKRPKDYEESDKIGMLREEEDTGEAISHPRVIDGFSVKFAGDIMRVFYNSSKNIKEFDEEFKEEVHTMLDNIVNFIKKKYSDEYSGSLKLEKVGPLTSKKNNKNKKQKIEPFIFLGAQGILEEDVRFVAYLDYKIKNAVSDEPADFEMTTQHNIKKKNLNEGFERFKKLISDKYHG